MSDFGSSSSAGRGIGNRASGKKLSRAEKQTTHLKTPHRFSRKKTWVFKILTAFLSPVFFVGLLELGLRLTHYGTPTDFFLKQDGYWVDNRQFCHQYSPSETATIPHPFRFPQIKKPGMIRIFVLGESAAVGTPDPSFNFSRILEAMLHEQFPDRKFEFINAAVRGINSHIILPIVRECVKYDPDFFLIYMGNNEAIGLHAPEPSWKGPGLNLRLLRLSQAVRRTKVGQLVHAILDKRKPIETQDKKSMKFFRSKRLASDDYRREFVYRNFRSNLMDMLQLIEKSHSRVLLSTVAVNLNDCPPLGSFHVTAFPQGKAKEFETHLKNGGDFRNKGKHEDALSEFEKAYQLDDRYADLLFLLAQTHSELGNNDQAAGFYLAARDHDALQFRSDSRLNGIIRDVSELYASNEFLIPIDADRVFTLNHGRTERRSDSKYFYEHVHLTLEGNYLLANAYFEELAPALDPTIKRPIAVSRETCSQALAFTEWDQINTTAAMVKFTGQPPFLDQMNQAQRQQNSEARLQEKMAGLTRGELNEAIATYENTLKSHPDDWQIRYNFASFLHDLKQFNQAAEQFREVVKRMDHVIPFRLAYGNSLAQGGKLDEAKEVYQQILAADSDHVVARESIEWIEKRR